MKACFLIAERRTIFCKDTLNICNFQIFRAVFYIEEWKVFLLLPSPPFTLNSLTHKILNKKVKGEGLKTLLYIYA